MLEDPKPGGQGPKVLEWFITKEISSKKLIPSVLGIKLKDSPLT